MKKIAIILFIVLFLPLVSAIEIQSTRFAFNGEEIDTIGVNYISPIAANIEVVYVGDFEANIIADLSELVDYQGTTHYTLSCQRQDEANKCTGIVSIRTTTLTNIPMSFQIGVHNIDHTHSFQIKNSEPLITKLELGDCGTPCFVAPSEEKTLNIHFNQPESFKKWGLEFSVLNEKFITDNCQGNMCKAVFRAPSTCPASPMSIEISANNRNDHYQRVSGELQLPVVCDSIPPQIIGVNLPSEIPQSETSFDVQLNVTEPNSPELTVIYRIVDLDYQEEHTCTQKEGDLFRCQHFINVQRSDGQAIRGADYNLQIIAVDKAGNPNSVTETIRVLSEDVTTVTEFTLNQKMAHPRMNVETLVFPRDSYVNVELVHNRLSAPYLREVVVNPNACRPVGSNTGQEGDIQNLQVANFEDDSFTLKFTVQAYGSDNRYQDADNLRFECPVTLYSRTERSIIQQGQTVNVTINIALENRRRLDQYTLTEFEEEAERLKELTELTTTLRRVFTGFQVACGGTTGVHGIFAGIGTIVQSLETLGVVVPGAKEANDALAETKTKSYERVQNLLGPLMQLCKFFTCDESFIDYSAMNSVIDNPVGNVVASLAEVEDIGRYSSDPYKSVVSAATHMCIPALLYHYERRVNIQCEYTRCMLESVSMQGVPPNFCKEARDVANCVMTAEHFTNLVTPVQIVKEAAANVQNVLRDPTAFFQSAAYYVACSPAVGLASGSGFCTKTHAILKGTQAVETVIQGWNALRSVSDDPCSGIAESIEIYTDYFANPNAFRYNQLDRGETADENPTKVVRKFDLPDSGATWVCQDNTCNAFDPAVAAEFETGKPVEWDKGRISLKDGQAFNPTESNTWPDAFRSVSIQLSDRHRIQNNYNEEYNNEIKEITERIDQQTVSEAVERARQVEELNKAYEEADIDRERIRAILEAQGISPATDPVSESDGINNAYFRSCLDAGFDSAFCQNSFTRSFGAQAFDSGAQAFDPSYVRENVQQELDTAQSNLDDKQRALEEARSNPDFDPSRGLQNQGDLGVEIARLQNEVKAAERALEAAQRREQLLSRDLSEIVSEPPPPVQESSESDATSQQSESSPATSSAPEPTTPSPPAQDSAETDVTPEPGTPRPAPDVETETQPDTEFEFRRPDVLEMSESRDVWQYAGGRRTSEPFLYRKNDEGSWQWSPDGGDNWMDTNTITVSAGDYKDQNVRDRRQIELIRELDNINNRRPAQFIPKDEDLGIFSLPPSRGYSEIQFRQNDQDLWEWSPDGVVWVSADSKKVEKGSYAGQKVQDPKALKAIEELHGLNQAKVAQQQQAGAESTGAPAEPGLSDGPDEEESVDEISEEVEETTDEDIEETTEDEQAEEEIEEVVEEDVVEEETEESVEETVEETIEEEVVDDETQEEVEEETQETEDADDVVEEEETELTAEELKELEEKLEQLDGEMEDLEKEMEEALEEVEQRTSALGYEDFSFIFESNRGFQALNRLTGFGGGMDWGEISFKPFSRGTIDMGWMNYGLSALEEVSNFERRYCASLHVRDRDVFLEEEVPLVRRAGTSFRIGVYITAREMIYEEGQYTYLIGGMINPKHSSEYKVILKSSVSVLDITEDITSNNRLQSNFNNPIGTQVGNQGAVTTNIRFNEVCLEFDNNLHNLFDHVQLGRFGFTGRTNEVCRSIEIEGSTRR